MSSTIEWTNRHDWNPIRGCTRASGGCRNCYAEIMAARFSKPSQWGHGFAEIVQTPTGPDHRWTGKVELQEDRLLLPLGWRKPAPGQNKCFITSTSDPFHESLADSDIDRLFAVMALRPDWIFQVLTKRSARMRAYLNDRADGGGAIRSGMMDLGGSNAEIHALNWPLPNVWLGVSVEDQARADERIPDLLATPAAGRFISAEPLLGPVDLREFCSGHYFQNALTGHRWHDAPEGVASSSDMAGGKLDWVIVGGESGPNARPMHPDWARSLRDQCAAAGVAFHFKQWGEWVFETQLFKDPGNDLWDANGDPLPSRSYRWPDPGEFISFKVGKNRAGRMLDGVEHSEFPA